jgi:AcrR family transcriptional regulator
MAAPASERRRELVAIASELFAAQGYQATTVREIAIAAGMLSGSLYHHFESKEAILDELLREYLDEAVRTYELIATAPSDPLETLQSMVMATFQSFKAHQAAITVYQQERQYLAQFSRFAYLHECDVRVHSLWTTVIEHGIATGALRADLDPKITYRFIRDAVWLAVRWFERQGPLSVDQLGKQYVDMILVGVSGPATRDARP